MLGNDGIAHRANPSVRKYSATQRNKPLCRISIFTIASESACSGEQENCSGQRMPFTANAFLDVFAAYNQAVWPFAAVLWLVTILVGGALVTGASIPATLPRLLLGGHSLW